MQCVYIYKTLFSILLNIMCTVKKENKKQTKKPITVTYLCKMKKRNDDEVFTEQNKYYYFHSLIVNLIWVKMSNKLCHICFFYYNNFFYFFLCQKSWILYDRSHESRTAHKQCLPVSLFWTLLHHFKCCLLSVDCTKTLISAFALSGLR